MGDGLFFSYLLSRQTEGGLYALRGKCYTRPLPECRVIERGMWCGAARGRAARGARRKFSMSSIKRDVKKKVLPRPEGEKILSRDPAHFTVRVPLDLRERFCF
jgi:hypothetical protein